MRSVVLALVLSIATVGAAGADTYTVDDRADAPDANTADGICLTAGGKCSLRAAVQQANAHPGADQIVLPKETGGPYLLTVVGSGEDAAATGDLDVTDDVSVTGADFLTFFARIDGNGTDRVFDVKAGVTMTLTLVEIRNGLAQTDPRGGGILNAGTLTLDRAVVVLNIADDGAGTGAGGGIYNLGVLTITDSTIFENSMSPAAAAMGAGVYNAGALTVVNSTVALNANLGVDGSAGGGAGIYNDASGSTDLRNATIAYNGDTIMPVVRGPGGGVFNAGGAVTMQNSVIAGNFSSPVQDCAGTLTSNGYNLVQQTSGCTVTGDLTGVQLGVVTTLATQLVYEGGHTPVVWVYDPSGSTVDTGNPAPPGSGGGACEARDQRGYNRTLAVTRCDLGAEEISRCLPSPPFASCRQHQGLSGKGKLDFKNATDDTKDALKWSFTWGPLAADSLFGNGADDYTFCIWDDTGVIGEALLPGGGTCAGKPCWKDSSKGLKYADKDATPQGVTSVRFTAGKSKVGLKGKGAALRLASPPWSGTVTVRLQNQGAQDPYLSCWETTHSAPKTNGPERYTAHGD